MRKKFATEQEKVRKDIECAFGVLVQRWHVLQRPLRKWYLKEIKELLDACVIIHNMVVEARHGGRLSDEEENAARTRKFPLFGYDPMDEETAARDGIDLFALRVGVFNNRMTSKQEHYRLKKDLTEHINNIC